MVNYDQALAEIYQVFKTPQGDGLVYFPLQDTGFPLTEESENSHYCASAGWGVKSHMKISGQFESETAADNHALNWTYIETYRRYGINEIDALQ